MASVALNLVLASWLSDDAVAGGYGDKVFLLRLPASLSRFSSYADVATAGAAVLETKGNVTWTGAIGVYPTEDFTIDLGVQRDTFPELETEFGR